MIQVVQTGKCAGCDYVRLNIGSIISYDKELIKTIGCERQAFCDGLEARLRKIIAQESITQETEGDEDMDKKGRTPRSIKECPHNPGVSCDLWKTEPQRCSACSWNEDKAVEMPPEGD